MGRGRHALALARSGFRTFGVDIEFDAVRDAVASAKAAAVAIHAPIGLRTIIAEWLGWRGRSLDLAAALFAVLIAAAGVRTVLGLYA